MTLAPVAFVAPGCTTQSCLAGRAVVAKAGSFAVCGAQSITRYRAETRHVPNVLDGEGEGNNNNNNGGGSSNSAARPSTVGVATYAVACVYGYGVTDTLVAYDYNDDYVVAATAARALHVWRTSDAEVVTSKTLPLATLTPLLQREGGVTAICLVGKHHCVLGTASGHVVSVNLSGRNEPRDVALPAAPASSGGGGGNNTNSSSTRALSSSRSGGAFAVPVLETSMISGSASPVPVLDGGAAGGVGGSSNTATGAAERVLCVAVSPVRTESVACGTRDGTLALLTLSASSGLHVAAVLRPFATAATAGAPSSLPVTAVAFSPTNAQHLLVASREGALALCDVAARALVMTFDYKAAYMTSLTRSSSSGGGSSSKDAAAAAAAAAAGAVPPLSSVTWSLDDAAATASARGGSNNVPTSNTSSSAGVFYTVSEASARMMQWNVSSSTRVAAMTVASKATTTTTKTTDGDGSDDVCSDDRGGGNGEDDCGGGGVVAVSCLDGQHAVLARGDGGVCVYNTSRQRAVWAVALAGHSDTLGDCRVSRHDSDVVASCSRDGVVRVWSLRQMTLQYALRVGAVAVCGVDWAPNGKHLALALGSGEVAVYATATRRVQWRVALFAHATTTVLWPGDDASVVVAASAGAVLAAGSSSGSGSARSTTMTAAPPYAHDSHAEHAGGGRGGVVILSAKEGVVLRRYAFAACSVDVCAVPSIATRALVAGGVDGALCVFAMAGKAAAGVSGGGGGGSSNDNNNGSNNNTSAPLLTLAGHTTGAVRCVATCPLVPHMLVTGADDATVRVWDLATSGAPSAHAITLASRLLRGHSDRVLCVAWCTVAPYLVLSGSADASVRLWDVRNGVAIAAMRSHCAAVCALSTHAERPLLFVSAARDGGVVVWWLALLRQAALDAALGTLEGCVVGDAAATLMPVSGEQEEDVVSVSIVTGTAVQRLLRDVRALSSEAGGGSSSTRGHATTTSSSHALSPTAAEAAQRDSAATRACERVVRLVDFFDYPCGAMDVAQLTSYVADAAHYSADARALVLPASHLAEARRQRARQLLDKARSRSVAAAGLQHRRSRLLDAADELLRVGLVSDACTALIDAAAYDRALAVAPALGATAWRETCVRVAEAVEAAGDDARASLYFALAEEVARAAQAMVRTAPRSVDAALVLCQTTRAHGGDGNNNASAAALTPTSSGVAAASEATAAMTRTLLRDQVVQLASYGNARLLAAALLARGRSDEAVRVLQHTGDATLAHLLVHAVPMREQASIDAAYRMSMLQCARARKWDVALLCATRLSNAYDGLAFLLAYFQCAHAKQLQHHSNTSSNSNNNSSSAALDEKVRGFAATVRQECAKLQLPLDAAAIQQRHASDGLASQNQIAAMTMTSESAAGGTTSTAVLQSICGFVESLLSVALQDIDGVHAGFYLRQARNVTSYVALPLVLPGKSNNSNGREQQQQQQAGMSMSSLGPSGGIAVPTVPLAPGGNTATTTAASARPVTVVHDSEQRRLLALAYAVAALMTVKVYRLPRLLNPAFQKARELASGLASVEALLSKMQAALGAYSPHSLAIDTAPVGCDVPALTSEGRCCRSALTGDVVCGAVHMLEDGASLLSKEEALAWSMCCAFSPLPTGAHMVVL